MNYNLKPDYISLQHLLSIVRKRLDSYQQDTSFRCDEHEQAIIHIDAAKLWLDDANTYFMNEK